MVLCVCGILQLAVMEINRLLNLIAALDIRVGTQVDSGGLSSTVGRDRLTADFTRRTEAQQRIAYLQEEFSHQDRLSE